MKIAKNQHTTVVFIISATICLLALITAPAVYAQAIHLEVPVGNTSYVSNNEGGALGSYMLAAYNFLVGVVGVLAAVMIMYAGFLWASAAGNSAQISKAKSYIVSSFVGLALALGSYMILFLINPALTILPLLEVTEINVPEPDDGVSVSCSSDLGSAADVDCNAQMGEIDSAYSSFGSVTSGMLLTGADSSWDNLARSFYNEFGKKVPVNHAFRSTEYQACLQNDPSADNPAGTCSSPHVRGVAVDISSSSLSQEEYNFLSCGQKTTCSYSNSGGFNKVSTHMGWQVLNYNPDKAAGRITEQHHFDYQASRPSVCTVCPTNVTCGCN